MNRDMRAANYLLLFFSVFSLVLLSLPLSGKVRTFRACATYLLNPIPYYGNEAVDRVARLPADAVRLITGDMELRNARQSLKEAAYVREELRALTRENERLAQALAITAASPLKPVCWARVLQRDALNWHRSLTVSAGSLDGVELNAPVLGLLDGELGVVGRIMEVGLRVSKVLLLTDDLSAVAAYLPAKGWEGLIQGQGTGKLRMNYLPVDADIEVGANIYTSATSATLEPDMLIGTVTRKYERDPFLAFQSVEVAPAIAASMLKEVMILSPVKGGGA